MSLDCCSDGSSAKLELPRLTGGDEVTHRNQHKMTQLENHQGRLAGKWLYAVLAIVAICAVTISVATRYSGSGSELPTVKSVSVVKSESQQFQRQRLLGNGLYWMPPVPSSALFQPPRASVPAVSAPFTSIHLDSESWLYNRPPPSF
jgi:hypothetical protein